MRGFNWFGLLTSSCLAVAMAGQNVSAACGSSTGAPTDNPVATKYGSTAYPWTGNIKWSCIFNINNYSGSTTVAKFNAARDAAAAEGGGIVFFPSGTYNFTDSITLKSGVVIRGATPSTTDGKSSTFSPPSKLVFPKYNQSLSGSGTANSTAFKKIQTGASTDNNFGVVYVDVNRGSVKLSGNAGVLAFGIRSNNSADPDPSVPTTWQNAWQRWSYRFNYNIVCTASQNALAANNRLNDAVTDSYDQPNYKVKDGTNTITIAAGSQARFNYTDHYGINVRAAETATGIVCRDNYVYHTMRVAIYGKGNGLIIRDNVIRDLSGKTAFVDPTGQRKVSNSATLENRAIDFAGANNVITGNDYQVERHLLNGGPYYSVDGEGILAQECCGGTLVNGLTISGNKGPKPTYIGLYKTRDIVNALITGNTVRDTGLGIYVNANTNGANYKLNNVDVTNNNVDGPITMTGDVTTTSGSNSCTGNTDPNGGGTITHSCEASVSISSNTGFTVNACK